MHKLFSSNLYNVVISKQIFLRCMTRDYDPSKAPKSCEVKEIQFKKKKASNLKYTMYVYFYVCIL